MIPGTVSMQMPVVVGGGTPSPPSDGTQYTIMRNIATSGDDGVVLMYGGTYANGFTTYNGFGDNQRYDCYYRFLNIIVPKGAYVNSASLRLFVTELTNNNNNYGTLHAMAMDNATNPTVQSVGLTVASVPVINLVPQTSYNFDVTACVQEVVSRTGWVSGNALCIKGNGAANGAASLTQFGAVDAIQYVPNYNPVLTVTYTA